MSLEASQRQGLFLLLMREISFDRSGHKPFQRIQLYTLKWSLCDFSVFSRYLGILTARLSPHLESGVRKQTS